MPATVSERGSFASFAARGGCPVSVAPGTYGIASSTERSHSFASSVNCCRLNGELSGSRLFGKIFVIARTRTPKRLEARADRREAAAGRGLDVEMRAARRRRGLAAGVVGHREVDGRRDRDDADAERYVGDQELGLHGVDVALRAVGGALAPEVARVAFPLEAEERE